MPITVRDALEGSLKGCTLLAGTTGLERVITYVGSMEVPNIAPWLSRGVFLITTGYAIFTAEDVDNTVAVCDLLNSLSTIEGAGLAIKTRFIGPIGAEAIALADELGIPLVEVPSQVRFVDLELPLSKAILDEQNLNLEYSQTIHSRFIELELNDGGIGNIADMVYNLMKSPIVITDGNFQIQAAKFKGNWNDAEKDFALFLEECRPIIDDFNLSAASNMDFSLERYDGRHLHYIMRKINLKSRIGGYIFVCSGTETPSEMSKIIIDHAATVTALELSKHEAIAEQTKITENHFFIDIITGNVKTEEEAKFRANNLQWISLPLSLVVFDVDRFEELSRTKTEKELYDIKERIAGIINVHMYSVDMKSTVLLKSDSFTCLIPHSYSSQMIESSVKIIQKEVLSQFSLGITAGICENVNSYLELGTAYNDARDAICISRREGRENSLVFIKNAKLEQALLNTANNVYFSEYLDLTLNRLIAYDKKNGTQLLETLTQLVECMGVRTAAAEKLFLHRNTLTYKIKKIESIIGCNLSRSEDLLCLGIAIKISRFVDNHPL